MPERLESVHVFSGTSTAVKLEAVVQNKALCKNVAMLSGEYQTFRLEAFHSLIIQFAPKMYVFSYTGMLCRCVLVDMCIKGRRHKNKCPHTNIIYAAIHRVKYKLPSWTDVFLLSSYRTIEIQPTQLLRRFRRQILVEGGDKEENCSGHSLTLC